MYFCGARVVIGEGVRGARRGEAGGDECPILASVALSAQVPTTCVGVDDGIGRGQGVVHGVERERILRPAGQRGEKMLTIGRWIE